MKNMNKKNRMLMRIIIHVSVFTAFLAFAENPELTDNGLTKPIKTEKIGIEKSRIEPVPLAVPLRLDYQGYLTDNAGNAITDTATMVFRIYTASSGGTELWNSGNQLITVESGVFHSILANVPMSAFEVGQTRWLELTVRSQVLSPRTEITSVPWSYSATIADSAGGSIRIGGQTLANLDSRYINSGETAGGDLSSTYPNPTVARIQTRAVSSSAPSTGQVLKWNGTQWAPANDTIGGSDSDWIISSNNMYSGVSGNVGIGTTSPQNKFNVNGVICGGTNDTVKAVYGGVLSGYSNLAGDAAADTGAVVCGGWNNSVLGRHSFVGGGYNNNVTATAYLYATVVGGYSNTASGASGATVVGGYSNTASGTNAFVGGGATNNASGSNATVGGGASNTAGGNAATVAGGSSNTASALYGGVLSGYLNLAGDAATDTGAAVCGGVNSSAIGQYSFVGGGRTNTASGTNATVAGGLNNTASGTYSATVAGGSSNRASGTSATVGGGATNNASANYATVAGGYADTSAATYSFSVGNHSVVPANYSNSAAFNGQAATASAQTRVGALSKASGTFTIDHPLDPMNKILNHYFIESPEMVLIYRGIAVIGAGGRAEVCLPDYFDALNKNPQIQLTGVGTYEVFIAEKVRNNSFVIGGKPGTEVHWTVTGERKDPSAEITKIIMPVEQPKDGGLAGRSLDDDFLCATREQLERMGKADKFHFRTQAGTQRYEEMKEKIQKDK